MVNLWKTFNSLHFILFMFKLKCNLQNIFDNYHLSPFSISFCFVTFVALTLYLILIMCLFIFSYQAKWQSREDMTFVLFTSVSSIFRTIGVTCIFLLNEVELMPISTAEKTRLRKLSSKSHTKKVHGNGSEPTLVWPAILHLSLHHDAVFPTRAVQQEGILIK